MANIVPLPLAIALVGLSVIPRRWPPITLLIWICSVGVARRQSLTLPSMVSSAAAAASSFGSSSSIGMIVAEIVAASNANARKGISRVGGDVTNPVPAGAARAATSTGGHAASAMVGRL